MKTHINRLISLFLSAVLIISSLGVSFQAIADEIENDKNENVTRVETLIKDYYDNHRNNLYSTKDEQAKAAARAKYDEASKAISDLSNSEKVMLNKAYYGFWLQIVQTDVIRYSTGKSPTTDKKLNLAMKELSKIEAVCGELPKEYKEVFEKFEPLTRKTGSSYQLSNKTNFKTNKNAQTALNDFIENIKSLSLTQLEFADYVTINDAGGYYFNQSNLTEKTVSSTFNSLIKLVYYEAQDVNGSGADPKAFSKSTYVKRSGSSAAGYTYAWASGKNAQKYIDDFDKYASAYQLDVIDQGINTINRILELTDSIDFTKNLSAAVNAVKETGLKTLQGENVAVSEIKNAISLQQNLSTYEQMIFSVISSSGNCKVLMTTSNVYTNADELTPEIAYTNESKLAYYNIANCLSNLNNKVYELMLEDFIDYIEKTDLSNVNSTVVSTAREKYLELPSEYKSKVDDDTFAKLMQIVKPEANHDDFASSIKDYKMTDIVRPSDSRIAWTVGGIQSVVDKLWYDVGFVANIAAPQLNLKNGLDTVLEENVYTNEMVSKIIDLYALLSRNELDLGVMNLTLGKVIKMLCSPLELTKALEETKYKKAVDKISEYKSFDETDEENTLEALSKVQFVSGDFGFEDGDREGFVDALLAILRPITNLLAPGAKALGLVALNINMFDYLDDDANYVNGVYANLIPALEAIGLTDIPTETEYKANYYKVVNEKGKNIAADEFLRPLLDALCTQFIDEVSPDPLNGLIKYLPSISYVIGTNMLNDCVKSALAQMGMLSGLASSLDLSADWINHKLCDNPLVISGVSVSLRPIDWLKLGNCATISSENSKSNSNDYLMLHTGETDTCFTTLFYYIYDVMIADENNYASVKTLLTSLLGDSASSLVTQITDMLAGYGKVKAYSRFLYWLGTSGTELIDSPDNPFIEKDEPTTKPTASSVSTTQPSTVLTTQKQIAYENLDVSEKTTSKASVKQQKTTLAKNYKKNGKNIVNTKQKKAKFKKLKASKKALTLYWSKVKGVKGYQIQLATDKKFKKNSKTITVNKQKTTKKTVKDLKSNKKYFVRIRTYKVEKINGKNTKVYSSWSKAKTVKTK